MTKSKQSPLQRINRIMDFLWKRGNNKESVNEVYRKIIIERLSNKRQLFLYVKYLLKFNKKFFNVNNLFIFV